MPFQFLSSDPFIGRPGLSGVAGVAAWAPFSGAVVDMDFKTGNYFGTTAAALTATTGSVKITGAGLQIVTGDLITTTNAALLAALNAATTVIRARVNIPSVSTGSTNGVFLAKSGANSSICLRLRASPNQSGVAAGHNSVGTGLAFASGATGTATDGVPFTMASRHRTTAVAVSGNGVAPTAGAPIGKSTTIDAVQFGISEAAVLLNGFIERLTIWTDDPTDTVLRARAT